MSAWDRWWRVLVPGLGALASGAFAYAVQVL
jgi:hypothetical protein